ncbi:VOC family protein [Nocardia callitridis]
MTGINGIGWFEIGTDNPAAAKKFYGDVFGWTVAQDETKSPDPAYQIFTTGDREGLRGALFDNKGTAPNHAIFSVLVDDVNLACDRTEAAGGKILVAPQTNPVGVRFAHILDPSGNHFSVFTTPTT